MLVNKVFPAGGDYRPPDDALAWLSKPGEFNTQRLEQSFWDAASYKIICLMLNDFSSEESRVLISVLDQIMLGSVKFRNILQDYLMDQINERHVKLNSKYRLRIQRCGGERFSLRSRPSYKKIKKKLKKSSQELSLIGFVKERGIYPPWSYERRERAEDNMARFNSYKKGIFI